METLAKAAYSSVMTEDIEKPKNALLEALNEFCAQTAKKPEDEKSTLLTILYGVVSNGQVQFYACLSIPALFIWRHNFTNFEKLHNDNVRLAKSLFHAIVPYREYHTVGDVIAPSLISLLYVISFLGALLLVIDGIHDIINFKDLIAPVFGTLFIGFYYVGGQALNSWLEKIGVSSSFKFQENDVIDIGEDIRGVVVKIDVSYVQIETETEGGGKVQKYVPGKMIADRIVTIIKKSKRRKEDVGGAGEEVLSDLKESVSDHYISELIRFAYTAAKETLYQALTIVHDLLVETAETLRRWFAFCCFVVSSASSSCWDGLCSRVAAGVAACRWAHASVQQAAMGLVRQGEVPISMSLSTPTADRAEPASTSATPSPKGRRGGGKSPTATTTATAAAAAASPVAPVAPAAPSRGRSRTPNPPRSRAAGSAPATEDSKGSSRPTARRGSRPGNTPR